MLFVSCVTNSNKIDHYIGTTGARYGITPFPDSNKWYSYLGDLNRDLGKKKNYSILWSVGTYRFNGIQMNFPGEGDDNLFYDEIDYNSKYLDFFSKKKVNTYLLIEVQSLEIDRAIKSTLEYYKKFSTVKGICIDFDFFSSELIEDEQIESWLKSIKEINKNFNLIIKHWDINRVEAYKNDSVLYLQSLEDVNSLEEVKIRNLLWSKKYYPSAVGVEIGYIDSNFWSEYSEPIKYIYNELNSNSISNTSIFWSESSLKKIVD
ncbi:hypothetical protein EW093_14040 [Thiospirochaeta perfilievii]|uniref:Glycoside-hydrolase family GH114 TIM-barrel domain-containing protein n=1 Tax=Thiospirochaeta perfilievii TaxID=252967 RepID=A0A5C1QCE8_9SPIO|nr:hypothetical protein [Thiospirochaeta perfilievii]QEN05773.1 hypothetical protein EW093_14040 [Thiospirochaeta perfilievii]